MDVNWILMAIAPLLIIAIWLIRKRAPGRKVNGDQSLGRLAEVIKSAEIANDGFFRSLELVQKNLEPLIAKGQEAERNRFALTRHLFQYYGR